MKKRAEFLDTIKEYNANYDLEIIGRAFDLACQQHAGQLRKSGEPYVIHPIAVAEILATTLPTPMRMIGIQDCFVKSGDATALYQMNHMTMEDVVAAATELVENKRK